MKTVLLVTLSTISAGCATRDSAAVVGDNDATAPQVIFCERVWDPIPVGNVLDEPHHGAETLILRVANERRESRGIDVVMSIDGAVVARDSLYFDASRNGPSLKEMRLQLTPGEHWIAARLRDSLKGVSKSFTITGKQWAYLAFRDTDETASSNPSAFTFEVSDKPIPLD